jgi:hypothetical protein
MYLVSCVTIVKRNAANAPKADFELKMACNRMMGMQSTTTIIQVSLAMFAGSRRRPGNFISALSTTVGVDYL